MTIFDQRGQQVNYQYNAAGNINFGIVKNKLELVNQLKTLRDEMDKAINAKVFDEDTAIAVEHKIKEAINQAEKPSPDKKIIVNYLKDAKTLIGGITGATGLVTALNQAIKAILFFF